MTPERYRKIKSIATAIEKLADRADDLELTLPNGGIVGSLLGTMATDLRVMLYKNDENMRLLGHKQVSK